ncbi:MAG: tRNA (adenosine(37)-N6)-threonylcarbamoyltransferase complex dimerization subunit type 1 TsaB [Chloroflexi bacterium]|nr:tRNA (adenosine(37)-N6)-threonylcarbamoyltransferase complex dimerization subunit type 1 TsaB [Chloroflexota bacterium]MCL5273119.1 tRNA (adenosine(37)-N6)-threonylcarbamoyltransferase complex dimerization subunit type 1 TsaB [Chloroflexota bacterium]
MTNEFDRHTDDEPVEDTAPTPQAPESTAGESDSQLLLPIPNLTSATPSDQTPILLAIDTCTNRSSVALRDAHTLRAECSWESDRHHTAAVSAQIRRLMAACGISPAQIGAVAVALGPGSFTGVRCGLAIAKGIAAARDVALIGVSALDVTVAAQPDLAMPIYALVEIGRSRVALARYEWQDGAAVAAGAWSIQSWKDFAASVTQPAWVCGDLTAGLIALLKDQATIAPAPLNLRRAGYLAEIGYRRWQKGDVDDPLSLIPIYPPES